MSWSRPEGTRRIAFTAVSEARRTPVQGSIWTLLPCICCSAVIGLGLLIGGIVTTVIIFASPTTFFPDSEEDQTDKIQRLQTAAPIMAVFGACTVLSSVICCYKRDRSYSLSRSAASRRSMAKTGKRPPELHHHRPNPPPRQPLPQPIVVDDDTVIPSVHSEPVLSQSNRFGNFPLDCSLNASMISTMSRMETYEHRAMSPESNPTQGLTPAYI
ncbi:unnamed protein product [Cyprideis torosa]|uniref:Uncharacterized protein n=1 Tax=Cyprideis torosa TaxID=163714 RepID=A0A7R8ZLH6_9CRUS|nr:unnamed protein product [Cyprideis torosa]CAG0883722.1 unnamed protein product [Cyprideis torosa]